MNVFSAVVESNGFAGAARKLGISPPAVTRAINDLEIQLGVQLLQRTTRVVRVTDAGSRYAEDCSRILGEIAHADESVRGLHSKPAGRLTVTAPSLFGSKILTPIVVEYLQSYPDVSVNCLFVDRIVNMLDEKVDVAVRIAELPDSSMQAIRVGYISRVICASPGYLKRHGIPRTIDSLTKHEIISSSSTSHKVEWRLVENGKSKSIKLTPRLITSTNESALTATLEGLGLARLPSYQVEEYILNRELKTVLNRFATAPVPVHVVHRQGHRASQTVRAFIDLTISELRKIL